MKKILLVGGCGYIGSAVFEYLKDKYHVDTVDLEWFGNFNNPNNLKLDFDELTTSQLEAYDIIFFSAAHSSANLCRDIDGAFDNNVMKFINFVRKLKKQKFIYASSSCVYVTSDSTPKVETDFLYPTDGLTLTKTTIDSYMLLCDVEYYGLRFGSVSGWSPNLRLDLMVNAMTLSAANDKQVIVFNGHAHRPILDINDLCKAVEKIIESDEDRRGIYNVASFNDNILNIGTQIAKYFAVPLVNKGNTFTYDFSISSQKFMDAFGFSFNTQLDKIVNTIVYNPFNENWNTRNEIPKK